MRTALLFLVLLALVSLPLSAFAQEELNCSPEAGLVDGSCLSNSQDSSTPPGTSARIDDTELNCEKAVTTLEIEACLGRQYSNADYQLNQAYNRLMGKMRSIEEFQKMKSGTLVAPLRAAQRAWLVFRDKECELYYSLSYPGTGAAGSFVACKVRLTKMRAGELDQQATVWSSRGY
jgi:uncharacterized protein YecT (DUF1311 family)